MAFGNASLPTRKYVYGAREYLPRARAVSSRDTQVQGESRQRFAGHDLAVDQLHKAHRFQNDLVAIERERRDASSAIIHTAFPDLEELRIRSETLATEVAAMRADLSQRHAAARSRRVNADFAAEVRTRSAELAAARTAYNIRRRTAYADPVIRAALDANDVTFAARVTALRSTVIASGLYWGTAAIVMTRVSRSGPPPQFKRWGGEGLLAVQFQRKPDSSSPKEPVLDSAGNPRIHPRSGQPMMRHAGGSSLRTDNVFTPNTNCWIERTAHPRHVVVHFRVSSTPHGKPVWAQLPTVLHRPFPDGAEIKWAYLSRRRFGTHFKWEVQFDVAASESAWIVHDGIRDADRGDDSPLAEGRSESGTVAVALGWRLIDGAVRVAVWVGSDGATGEVVIPAARVRSWLQTDDLQSIRDTEFDRNHATLLSWLASRTEPLSQEWQERLQHVARWRGASRHARLVLWWRDNRLPGDEGIFNLLEGETVRRSSGRQYYTGGRRQDKHLYDWSEYRRLTCRNWRKNFYRDVALQLASRYKNVVTADIDWHAIAENPLPEETDDKVNKKYRSISACAMLRDELTDCLQPVEVSAPGITVTCHACGAVCDPPGRGRWVTCERCGGEVMDRAYNAAKNLLARGLMATSVNTPARVM